MGSLSEYINGYRGRHSVYNYDSPRFNTRTGSLNKGGDNGGYVQVSGFVENMEMMEHLLTTDVNFARNIRNSGWQSYYPSGNQYG